MINIMYYLNKTEEKYVTGKVRVKVKIKNSET